MQTRIWISLIFNYCLLPLISFSQSSFPVSKGRIAYHSYSDYSAWDGKLYMLDLAENKLTEISKSWNIDHAINAHFSPDGSLLTFMGDETGEPRDWDIFLWEVDSDKRPLNLTKKYNQREEDPKFSPDGRKIVFKQTYWNEGLGKSIYDLKELNLSGDIINIITSINLDEESMPYYSSDGSKIFYSRGSGSSADIYSIELNGSQNEALANVREVQEYYPITRDSNTFLFTRWFSENNHHDQIYLGYFSDKDPLSLALNERNSENADPYPVGPDWVLFSSTRSNSSKGYDIFIGHVNSGEVWSLDDFGVNTSLNELGACFFHPDLSTIKPESAFESQQSPVLLSSYPNPFNSQTKITLYLDIPMKIEVAVYDMTGRHVTTLEKRHFEQGDHELIFDGRSIPSGNYVCQLISTEFIRTSKLILMK